MTVTLLHNGASVDAPLSQPYETSRFGTVQIVPESIVEFPDGLVGLGGRRYALISTDTDSPFVWLQSLEHPALALPVTNPHRFFSDFKVELQDQDAADIGLDGGQPADVYVTVTASSQLSEFTANLKAPILLRDGVGHQLLNQSANAAVKARLFPG